MARLYHPDLGREYECPDDEGLLGVLAEAGWLPAPEPEAISPAHAPEPVRYAPVTSTAVGVSGDYENFTVAQLQGELEDRGLTKSGTKDELIARLVEDDET